MARGNGKADKPAYVTENLKKARNKEAEITSGAGKKSDGDISFYEASDQFQVDNGVSENDEEIFYGSVFQEFNEQWLREKLSCFREKSEVIRGGVDFFKLSLEEHAKLLPLPTADQMAELKVYQKWMG